VARAGGADHRASRRNERRKSFGPARSLAREHRFAAAIAHTFAPPADLTTRLDGDTLVCRCEDVAWSALRGHPDLRSAKLATRCGMGHCQGRICHDALALMTGAPRLAPTFP
jgi:hypothetical protein